MKNIIISNNVIKKNKKIIFNSLIKKLGFKKISKKKIHNFKRRFIKFF